MSLQSLEFEITGTKDLLQSNPQVVDRFNPYNREMAKINAKRTKRTDEDYIKLSELELRSKIYWDQEAGIYIPSSWVIASISAAANRVAKSSKRDILGSIFIENDKIPLKYTSMNKVKAPEDIIKNKEFCHRRLTKQGQVRIAKSIPVFKNWSFKCALEFDDTIIDKSALINIITHTAKYVGYGDFRPSFGTAIASF